MGFKMKGWSGYQNSPVKQKYTITWSDKEAEKRHNEKIKKEQEEKKKKQEKVDAQIEGTYELTEEDIKKMKEDEAKNPKRPSPNKHGKLEDFQYGRNGHNPDTMSAKHEDWHLKQSGESPNKQLKTNYWYKVNGKKVPYSEYKRAWKEGVDERRPNLQTNDPDAFGIKAKHKADREKLRKHTVLTKEQTDNLKNKK